MKLFLKFSPEIIKNPIIADIILETGAKLNINKANITPDIGEIITDVPKDKVDIVMDAFKKHGVEVTILEHPVIRDDEKCINCGTCISICPADVFLYEEDWSVSTDVEKCIRCGVCVYGCPLNALALGEDGS
ncbi:MAG: 4Fe-4S binding protein [Halobacteriota archaeon]|nr:4Fe-4S binding protein [Halobacteriota archaeon]